MKNSVEIIPLGGVGEFGMNCLGVRHRGQMVVVDAGMGFPEETPYGVDISVPRFDHLERYRDEITALILTHGHEDHIGSVPYFLKEFNVPVYGSNLTLAFVERKLVEHDLLDDVLMHRVSAGQVVEVEDFGIEFIHASHSLVDCFSVAIETPLGTIVHSGDYKIDDSPVIGAPYDLDSLGRIGERGILALLADSTNATVPGRTPSETDVIPEIQKIFEETQGRLFLTTFSSSIHRLQIVFDLAEIYGKRVCVLGRSMLQNVETAERLSFLNIRPGTLIDLSDARALDDDEVVFLVTGSQGEARAVMWNLATQSYKGLSIEEGDTVVHSARTIPGNEKRISQMIGAIYRRGGNVVEEKRRLIHVSGHASQEDIRILTETAQPKYLVPIHGEYRMLYKHREYATQEMGFETERVPIIENGDVLELTADSARVTERNDVGKTFIGDVSVGEIEFETVKERKRLAYNGVVSVVVKLDRADHTLIGEPQFTIHGVTGFESLNGFEEEAASAVRSAFEELTIGQRRDDAGLRENIRIHLKRFIKKRTGARPGIVTTFVEFDAAVKSGDA